MVLSEEQLRYCFRRHPRGDRIIDALVANQVSFDELSESLKEAERLLADAESF